ncbi:MAG: DegT/DnrJ/EryC1/StrS aminotransferase family protein [Ignavibacteriales bacterium]|nr:DegT/DnrJ/EryC1/StrS aminotransferase family protein [Ignavibacteriales bacterium]
MQTNTETKKHVPVSQPVLGELESEYVNKALRDNAISGFYGEYLSKFENGFAEYCGCKYGVTTTSGTTALHLAMLSLSIGAGDEVLVSSLTNMATFFAVLYTGAKPIPVDIEKDTLNIDPKLIEEKITEQTKAILVVHLFGHPVDMDPVTEIARRHNLFLVEDCAQAHGAEYKGKKVGSFGDIGCFSFYANKILTTGEGGMIITNNSAYAEKAAVLKSLAFGVKNKFMHQDIGYNYRMTNLQAALGCAQLERIENIIDNKRKVAQFYSEKFADNPYLQLPVEKDYAKNVYWMYHVVLKGILKGKREIVMNHLTECRIETREGFIPYNMQNVFIEKGFVQFDECPAANDVAYSGFYLPSGPNLSGEDLEYVAENFLDVINSLTNSYT